MHAQQYTIAKPEPSSLFDFFENIMPSGPA
jgi:hypothetical protein